jgi:hypothetical protein
LRSRRFRLPAVAALTLSGLVLAAGVAGAAPSATIDLDPDDVVFTDEVLHASGVCIDGSLTAVVVVTQNGDVIDEVAVSLDADLDYDVELDLTSAVTDIATATVECYRYDDAAPLDTAEAQFFIADEEPLDEIPVTVSPSSVAIGTSFTISATCPEGSTVAAVLAGSGDNDDPFLEEEVTPGPNGEVSFTTVLRAGELVQTGDAAAVVFCGTDDELLAVGFSEFTITAARAAAAPVRPVAAGPVLANTGSDNGPLVAVALGLLVLGLGAHGARRATR